MKKRQLEKEAINTLNELYNACELEYLTLKLSHQQQIMELAQDENQISQTNDSKQPKQQQQKQKQLLSQKSQLFLFSPWGQEQISPRKMLKDKQKIEVKELKLKILKKDYSNTQFQTCDSQSLLSSQQQTNFSTCTGFFRENFFRKQSTIPVNMLENIKENIEQQKQQIKNFKCEEPIKEIKTEQDEKTYKIQNQELQNFEIHSKNQIKIKRHSSQQTQRKRSPLAEQQLQQKQKTIPLREQESKRMIQSQQQVKLEIIQQNSIQIEDQQNIQQSKENTTNNYYNLRDVTPSIEDKVKYIKDFNEVLQTEHQKIIEMEQQTSNSKKNSQNFITLQLKKTFNYNQNSPVNFSGMANSMARKQRQEKNFKVMNLLQARNNNYYSNQSQQQITANPNNNNKGQNGLNITQKQQYYQRQKQQSMQNMETYNTNKTDVTPAHKLDKNIKQFYGNSFNYNKTAKTPMNKLYINDTIDLTPMNNQQIKNLQNIQGFNTYMQLQQQSQQHIQKDESPLKKQRKIKQSPQKLNQKQLQLEDKQSSFNISNSTKTLRQGKLLQFFNNQQNNNNKSHNNSAFQTPAQSTKRRTTNRQNNQNLQNNATVQQSQNQNQDNDNDNNNSIQNSYIPQTLNKQIKQMTLSQQNQTLNYNHNQNMHKSQQQQPKKVYQSGSQQQQQQVIQRRIGDQVRQKHQDLQNQQEGLREKVQGLNRTQERIKINNLEEFQCFPQSMQGSMERNKQYLFSNFMQKKMSQASQGKRPPFSCQQLNTSQTNKNIGSMDLEQQQQFFKTCEDGAGFSATSLQPLSLQQQLQQQSQQQQLKGGIKQQNSSYYQVDVKKGYGVHKRVMSNGVGNSENKSRSLNKSKTNNYSQMSYAN